MTAKADEPKGVYDALLKVQDAVEPLTKDAQNPRFGSFTSLKEIVEKVGPLLAANDLTWTTLPRRNDHGFLELAYELKHVPSGEAIEDAMPLLLAQEDMQALGSAVTYARRYALQSVLNLVSDDDDGNAASTPRNGQARASQPATPAGGGTKMITAPQKTRVRKALKDSHTVTPEQIAAATKRILGREITSADELTSREASKFIDGLEQGALPEPDHPSDIPDEQESFDVPAGAVGTDPAGDPF